MFMEPFWNHLRFLRNYDADEAVAPRGCSASNWTPGRIMVVMHKPVTIVILAAGLGTRMKSRQAKVLHRAGGKNLLQHVVDTALELAPAFARPLRPCRTLTPATMTPSSP